MSLTINDYLTHINTSNHFEPIARVELLTNGENIVSNGIFTGRIISGNLNVKKNNGIRRTSSLVLSNNDGKLNPSPDIFWVNQKYALYLGFKINDEDFFIRQGVFIADNPSIEVDGSMSILNISGQDKWSLLDGSLSGILDKTNSVPVDSDPNAAISTLLATSNINDPKSLLADATSILTKYTISVDMGESYGDVILELTNMLSRNVYYDINGNLNSRDDIADELKASLYDFNNGTNFQYLGGKLVYDYKNAYNAVKVIGDNINGQIFDALVENRNNASPLSIDKIGYKLKQPILDPNIYTEELALGRANYELIIASRLSSKVQFSAYPVFHLDVDNICRVTDFRLGLDSERLLINGYQISFGDNPNMTIDATRTQELLFDFN